jgi:hypothetical protein
MVLVRVQPVMKCPDSVQLSREDGEALRTRLAGDALTADDRRVLDYVLQWYFWLLFALQLTFRTPSEGDPRIFPWAFFARTAPPSSGMLASPERRYTKSLHPGRVLWVSCYRPSKRTKSNICPL